MITSIVLEGGWLGRFSPYYNEGLVFQIWLNPLVIPNNGSISLSLRGPVLIIYFCLPFIELFQAAVLMVLFQLKLYIHWFYFW